MKIEPNNIYLGDCLDVMKDIPDNTIDCVICDLPYGTTEADWDSVIPMDKLWAEYDRVCTSTANILLFGSEPFSTTLRMNKLDIYKYDLVWIKNKPTGFFHAQNMPLKDYELISVFSYGSMGHSNLLGKKRMTYNPQNLIKTRKVKTNALSKMGGIYNPRPSHKDSYVTEWTNYPSMTLFFDVDTSRIHQTAKPVDLLRYLVLTFTNENDVVLDNTCGAGSTLVACIKEKRQYIGIELNKEYYDIAEKRINEEKMQLNLF